MALISTAITLFAILMVDEAQATSNDERLAEMFSPILILTEETNNRYDETVPIRVIKPEPVEIVGADSVKNIWISGKDLIGPYPRRNKLPCEPLCFCRRLPFCRALWGQ